VFGEPAEEWEVEVHAMAARPEKEARGALAVEFAGLEVKWAS
jgi:Tfp pilus assembly PilM family ATPase